MPQISPTIGALLLSALIGFGLTAPRSASAAEIRRFAVVSDIHFNPFATPTLAKALANSEPEKWRAILGSPGISVLSRRGEDTNAALLESAMAALSRAAADADFLLVPGDFLAHEFEELAAKAVGASPASENIRALTLKTVSYVGTSLQAAVPGRPVVVALGNNDSDCGDYRIEPGGAFLAATLDIVRELAGAHLVAKDFEQTYRAAGYYSMRHPTLPNTTIVVLNDVVWSADYRNACGENGLEAAGAMMNWLERHLVEQRARGGRVWLLHHIPVGIDSYDSSHDPGDSCPARVTGFLKEPFASQFSTLMRVFAGTIRASYSGHTHRDSYRLVMDAGKPVLIDKIAPAISPIFGNNPGFHMIDYDRDSGEATNLSTWQTADFDRLQNGAAPTWRQEYVFTRAFDKAAYAPSSLGDVMETMATPKAAAERRDAALRLVGRSEKPQAHSAGVWADLCAIVNLDVASFTSCACGGGSAFGGSP
ncbi:metallophosphoesterase [Microvirga antarctica]|uniref:metallophosphoesterase n=1 Tax=Microvirga antarctica TaxID=2819233 RepID=UPI001B303B92|nr:metallophosphoesterase [Microvirga antarctica]